MSKIVIVDIDGTISKVGDRLKYLQQSPKDWDKFYEACFEDKPISPIINLIKLLILDHKIIFCTGRRESVREQTTDWIQKHLGLGTFVPPHPKEDQEMWGSNPTLAFQYGVDKNAISVNHHASSFGKALKTTISKGFKPLEL